MDINVFTPEVIGEHTRNGHWDDESIAERIARHATSRPNGLAFVGDDGLSVTWREYDEISTGLAAALTRIGLDRGDPLGILLPDGPTAHLAYVAAEKAGLVAIGIGPRAGLKEIAHILRETGTTTLVSLAEHRGAVMPDVVDDIRSLDTPIDRHVFMRDFDVDATLEAIEQHRVTVLAAVTTQVLMLLGSPKLATTDLSSLRIVQSGGERVPFEPAAEFERRTGAKILQFYGSNEAGCVCGTTVDDTTAKRLGTAGRIFPEMHVRLFDDEGNDVTAGGVGRSACKGPGITPGYYGNAEANAKLFRPDGWMYLGDIVQIDEDDYLRVVGRTADFIIRGGQNISAPAVEEELLAHPRVAMAAVVAMPDPVLGERVCAYVVTSDGGDLGVDDLARFLDSRGVSKSMWPERVVRVDELPRGAGAKIGKAELRADIERRLEEEQPPPAADPVSAP